MTQNIKPEKKLYTCTYAIVICGDGTFLGDLMPRLLVHGSE
jgi:hypothetical protein